MKKRKSEQRGKPKYTWHDVESKLRDIAVVQFGVTPKEVSLDADFGSDFGADSLDLVEYVMEVEDEFDLSIPDETAEKVNPPTIANMIRMFVAEFPQKIPTMVDTKVLSFRVRPDRSIEVALQLEDGAWTYADGQTLLPSMIYVFTVSRWKPILKELEDLINDPNAEEQDLQVFFEEYPELVAGDDYDKVIPQATIARNDGKAWRADFVLAPLNQTDFCKIIELKLPRIPLITPPRRGHIAFGTKVWQAICQIKDYADAFDSPSVRERFKKKYQTEVFKPDMHLIAGRKWNMEWVDNIRQLRKSTPVRIEDWDSVIERLKRRYE